MPKNLEILAILLEDDFENPLIDYTDFISTITWDLIVIHFEQGIVVDYAKLIQQRWLGEPDNPETYIQKRERT